jgi:late competence protein required for DNA uptake (superfamily II DNA/RNA helicase)
MSERIPTISPRLPGSRQDNKLILKCQACHAQSLVDVKIEGVTDWYCTICARLNRVKSERHERHEWIHELARKAGLRK